MHDGDLPPWEFNHRFESGHEAHSERQTRIVVGLTLVMMVVEIVAGTVFHSMALLADGWHMGTHAGALGIAALAYAFARGQADNPRFAFGTGKVGVLAAFASAILLGVVALFIVWESASRLVDPPSIAFTEAIAVAVVGLAVNMASAWVLGRQGGHGQGHEHEDGHTHGHALDHDHNLRAAYLHVVADALTSVLAIGALLFARYLGWRWMDPAAGIVGAVVITYWAIGLIRQSGGMLLDWNADPALNDAIRAAIEGGSDNSRRGDRITDLHVWRIGSTHFAAMLSVLTDDAKEPGYYKQRLRHLAGLVHVTVEVHARDTTRTEA